MKTLTNDVTAQIGGAGVPMPMPHLKGSPVSDETKEFFGQYGKQIAAGAAAGALGGPVGAVIGGAIGATVGAVIKG